MSEQFTAELTREQVEESERIHEANGWVRRMGLMMLTQSQAEIAALFDDNEAAHGVLDLHEALKVYTERAKAELELLKAVEARLLLVMMQESDRRDAMEGGA